MQRLIILMIISFIGMSACNDKKEINKVGIANCTQENLLLLAIKYDIDEKILSNFMIEYELLTTGSSITERYIDLNYNKDKKYSENKTLVGIIESIKIISEKYSIQPKILADIFINYKLLEKESYDPPDNE